MTNHSFINYYERQKRGILASRNFLWREREIPFYVHPRIDSTFVKVALARISSETCLIFRYQRHYNESLFVFLPGRYYETNLGKRQEIPHKIFMPVSGIDIGKITREVLRALGLDYEHNRGDRHLYIRVYFRNIKSGYTKYFTRNYARFTQTYDSLYDYRSIMHFSKDEYAKRYRRTLHAYDAYIESSMGKAQQLSFYDAMLVNKKYCSFPMIQHPECFLNGYQHPRTPHICKCLPFTSGNQCENIIHQPQHCTGNNFFFATHIPRQNTIRVGGKCIFVLRAREGKKIKLKLKFHVPNYRRYGECNERNSVEVKTDSDITVSGFLFCPNGNGAHFISPNNVVTLVTNFLPPTNFQLNITFIHW